LGPFVLDFFCYEAAIAVEVDGLSHELGEDPARDRRRDEWIADQGVRSLRFRALDIRDALEEVVTAIVDECSRRTAARGPSTAFGGPLPLQMQGRLGSEK
jgi:very-short-patch-repair endonuclease